MGAFVVGITMNRGQFSTAGLQCEGVKQINRRSGRLGLVPGMTRGVRQCPCPDVTLVTWDGARACSDTVRGRRGRRPYSQQWRSRGRASRTRPFSCICTLILSPFVRRFSNADALLIPLQFNGTPRCRLGGQGKDSCTNGFQASSDATGPGKSGIST